MNLENEVLPVILRYWDRLTARALDCSTEFYDRAQIVDGTPSSNALNVTEKRGEDIFPVADLFVDADVD